MKLKKILALLLSLCLVLSMVAACGSKETPSETKATTDTNDEETNTDTEATDEDEDEDEEMAYINIMFIAMGSVPSGLQEIEDAINEITEAEINTHVTLEMVEGGNYVQQTNLKISGNEKLDLMVTLPMDSAAFTSMVSQNQLQDISDLLAKYAPDTLELVEDIISATSKGDAIYGVPTYRCMETSAYVIMRTDVLEDLGLLEKAQNMTSLAEYTEILEAVKASDTWSHLAGIVPSDATATALGLGDSYLATDTFADATFYDTLGDSQKLIGINPDGSDATVYNNFASDEYYEIYKQMKEWYDAGYVYKDITTTQDYGDSLVKSNVAFSLFCQSEIGIESSKAQSCGYDMTCVKIGTLPMSTGSVSKFVWTVPTTATEPEAAVKFLNMMYTDSRICNLLAWGVEGVNYNVVDGEATFVEGESASENAYHTVDFLYGNQFLVLPWEGQGSDFRDIAKAAMDSCVASAYLGFFCDTTSIQTEISAVGNVVSEYKPSIDGGVASEADYEAFLKKMDDNGLQKIIDEYQSQLDAWIAENK